MVTIIYPAATHTHTQTHTKKHTHTHTHVHRVKYQQINMPAETGMINVCDTDKHTITVKLSSLEDTQSQSVWCLSHTHTHTHTHTH